MIMLAAKSRAKASNGHLLHNVHGRSSSARRFRDLCRSYEAEVAGQLAESERALIKQAAMMTMKAEQLQSDLVNGLPVDSDEAIRLSSEVRRILSSIGQRATVNAGSR